MAISVSELYDALIEAGVSKEAARKAAEAVISRHEAEQQLATKRDLLEAKNDIIKWNVGTIVAAIGITIAIAKLV